MAAKKKNSRKSSRKRPKPDIDDLDDDEDEDDSDVVLVEDDPPGNLLTRFLFRPKRLLLLAMVLGVYFGWPQVMRLFPDLGSRSEYRITASKIRISEAPPWVPADLTRQALERAKLPSELSLLDADVVEKVAEALRAHPWVEEVVQAQKDLPAGITVELRYRKPVAMVRVPEGFYPVDARGVLLPPKDFSFEQAKRYPLIENVTSSPRGPSGTGWGDPLVIGAAKLADALAMCWTRLELAAIRVPDTANLDSSADDAMYELWTPGGSRILWGRAPGSDHPGELSAEQKIGRLEKYRADFGRFDQVHGPYEIDIRHWQEISRRPLSAGMVPDRR